MARVDIALRLSDIEKVYDVFDIRMSKKMKVAWYLVR